MNNEAKARRIVYTYEIRLKGHLDARRTRHFEGLTATWLPCGETLLVGPLADQAALFGVLDRIRDLGIILLAVRRVEMTCADEPATNMDKE